MKIVKFAVLGTVLAGMTASADLTLAENGTTGYTITATPERKKSAEYRILKQYLRKMTGVEFKDSGAKESKRIFLGDSPELRNAHPLPALEDQEALVMTKNGDLILSGGGKLGTAYAVYTFLEEQGGCRWYTPYGDMLIPQRKNFNLPELNIRKKQTLKYRHISVAYLFKHPFSKEFLHLNRLNIEDANFRGSDFKPQISEQGPQCHTLFYYIPPQKTYNPYTWKWKEQKSYFETNPDFFSMNNLGKRVSDLQLCFSNRELRKELTRRLLERIELLDGIGVFNISAMDWPGNFCFCPECKKLERKLDCIGGPLFDYLIETADFVKSKYPDVLLSTLVYRKAQSEKPPRIERKMPENLVFIFAPIDDDFSKPFTHPNNRGTLENLVGWAKLTKNIWLWYYPAPYSKAQPFAALDRMAADIRTFAALGFNGGFFEHDTPGTYEGFNFADLTTWLILKLYQNPAQDHKKLISEFCEAYYGAAAPLMQEYLAALEKKNASYKGKLVWNAAAASLGYSVKDIRDWQNLFDRMEKSVKTDSVRLAHVRDVRVQLNRLNLEKWREFCKIYPQEKNALEKLHARTKAEGIDAITRRCTVDSIKKARIASFNKLLENTMLRASITPKPLPDMFAGVPEEKIFQAVPSQVNGCGFEKMKDAAFGVAIRENKKQYELPWTFGLYDGMNKKFLITSKITKQQIVPDRFHFYKLGTSHISGKTHVWMTASWRSSVDIGEFCEVGNPFKKYDIYVSLKFEGPGYSDKSKAAENNVWCDRILLVESSAK